MDDQSTLHPASDAARDIADLWWVLFVVSAIVCAFVILLVLLAVARGRTARDDTVPNPHVPDSPFARGLILVAGIAVPAVVLTGLFILTVRTLPSTSAPTEGEGRLTVSVTGRQWFWDVDYPGRGVRTANEIHIPVGVPVRVNVSTQDVIHSFWVPRLNRKIDMIPGRRNSILLEAKRPGVYRGQCAEFCGLQHAYMAFYVVAHEPAQFRTWLARAGAPAREPATAEERRGRDVFLSSACAFCHTLAGTAARGRIGPDLTHIGSRLSIGAGTVPLRRGYLAAWVLDPQHIKPGVRMPGTEFGGPELQALLAYLESLR